jgi:hypothetical protein
VRLRAGSKDPAYTIGAPPRIAGLRDAL